MSLTLKQTAQVIASANTDAAKLAAKITVGNVLNENVTKLIAPKLPMMVRGYADSALGKAFIANAVSAALIHFAPTNRNAQLAAEAMINSAMLEFAASFNIEAMINELIAGVDLSVLESSNG